MVLTKEIEDLLRLGNARDIAQAKLRKAREAVEVQIQPLMLAAKQAEEALKLELEK